MKIAVLDIGGTAVKYGLYRHGTLCCRGQFDTLGAYGAQNLLNRCGDVLEQLRPFDAIGVSSRGQITREGTVFFDTEDIRGWSKTAIAAILRERFMVPVAVENDVNCMALGEGSCGAAKGLQNYLCVAFGTGIGAGIVLNGQLFRGARGFAGEVGLMPFRDAVWETYTSASALITEVQTHDPAITDGHSLCARLQTDKVRSSMELWFTYAAQGLCGLIYAFDPEAIILGGSFMSHPKILSLLSDALYQQIIPGYETTQIIPAQLGPDAMLLGAATAAKRFVS